MAWVVLYALIGMCVVALFVMNEDTAIEIGMVLDEAEREISEDDEKFAGRSDQAKRRILSAALIIGGAAVWPALVVTFVWDWIDRQ